MGASSRLRSMQYVPFLEGSGIELDVYPLFDDRYLERLYAHNSRSVLETGNLYLRRAKSLRQASDVDLIWLEKEALPYVPFFLEKLLVPSGVPYIVDYDDAVFHNYDLSPYRVVRKILGKKIDHVMTGAKTVVCGNDYLAQRAKQAGARRLEIVPTVVDARRYTAVPDAENTTPVIGWIGSPSTQQYVLNLSAVLEQLFKRYGIHLVLVGAQPWLENAFGDVPVQVLPWDEEDEADLVASFDIGIMPLADGPWERGKCGYKLIQYMACGKPVVASPIGMNATIVNSSACGRLAYNEDEWFGHLAELATSRTRRIEFGKNGRLAVEEEYSVQTQAPRMLELMRRAMMC